MRRQKLDASDPISILSLLKTFKTACVSSRISEGATTRLIYYLMKRPLNCALFSCLQLKSSRSSRRHKKDGKSLPYGEIVNNLPATYAMGNVIADSVSDIHLFTQCPGFLATVYWNAFWTKFYLVDRGRMRPSWDDCWSNDFSRLFVKRLWTYRKISNKRLHKHCHGMLTPSAESNQGWRTRKTFIVMESLLGEVKERPAPYSSCTPVYHPQGGSRRNFLEKNRRFCNRRAIWHWILIPSPQDKNRLLGSGSRWPFFLPGLYFVTSHAVKMSLDSECHGNPGQKWPKPSRVASTTPLVTRDALWTVIVESVP